MRGCLGVILTVALVATVGQQTVRAQQGGLGATGSRGQLGSTGSSFGSTSGSGSTGGIDNSAAGQIQGNERFIRGNRQPGQFVGGGRDSADGGFVGSQAAGTSPRGSQSSGRLSSLANRDANQPNRSSRTSRNEVRARMRLGFSVARPAPADVAFQLQTRLERIIWPKASFPIQVQIEKGTAILRGAVPSAHDRAIAERLVLLEGGIWKVQNELTVSDSENRALPK